VSRVNPTSKSRLCKKNDTRLERPKGSGTMFRNLLRFYIEMTE
jgi:hypothetical protein